MKSSLIKILSCALLVAVCCAPALAQDKGTNVTSEYDRFKDVTTIGFEPMKTSDPSILFFAMFECPGNAPCTPESIMFVFAEVTLNDAPYQGEGVARAIRDGVRQEPYQLKYVGVKPIVFLPAHVFAAKLRPDGVTKIAYSQVVEFQIDSSEFKLTPENLAVLKALVRRMQ